LVFGFVTVSVMTLVPPDAIVVGLKAFVAIGGMYTARSAVFDGVPGVGASVVVTPLVVFGFVPNVLEVT